MDIAVRLLDPRLADWGFPTYGSALSAGLDLFACLDAPIVLPPQAPAVLISSGIAIRIGDPQWCALLYPRSGLGHKKGLVLGNTVGVVDADYEGTVFVSAWNRNPPGSGDAGAITIAPGERIAQLVLTRIERPRVVVVESFGPASARGAGGFGSTGA